MQITDHSKQQVLLGVQRLRSMASSATMLSPPLPSSLNLTTDLSISLNSSSSLPSIFKPSLSLPSPSPPVQLDLLPLYPSPVRPQFFTQQAPTHNHNHSLSHSQLFFSSSQYPPSLKASIDVNQIPSSSDSEEDEEEGGASEYPSLHFSQRGSAMDGSPSSFQKREREKVCDSNNNNNSANLYEVSSRASDEEEGGSTRKKLRLSKEQSALLEESFKEHSTLNPKQKNALAKQLNLRPRQVEVWFQNRRARTKLKQTEVDCELLKRCCESLTEENRRLQKEVQELRALKVGAPCVIAHDFYMPLPAATLTMCPSCERLGSVHSGPKQQMPQAMTFNAHHSQPSAAC